MRFTGKTIVVTGSGSGIGAQTVRRFAAEGANVVVADINLTAAQQVASSVDGALAVKVDVSSRDALRSLVETVTETFGGIDVFINNAMSCCEAGFLDITPDEVQ
ncbi:MAG: SDR family NAD(P)-dependent oxidoreductase [Actinomycetales bacterium]|nr:SDR family NAD(P)-dependent oxidoreductase [Actinomycetales bacterium]